jgi:hypothetical protein
MAEWCNVRYCIWARSTTASTRLGAGIEVFDEDTRRRMQLALFAAEREVPKHAKAYSVQVRLDAMQIASAAAMGRLLACLLVVRATRA